MQPQHLQLVADSAANQKIGGPNRRPWLVAPSISISHRRDRENKTCQERRNWIRVHAIIQIWNLRLSQLRHCGRNGSTASRICQFVEYISPPLSIANYCGGKRMFALRSNLNGKRLRIWNYNSHLAFNLLPFLVRF